MHTGPIGLMARVLLAAGGFATTIPGGGDLGLSHVQLSLAGFVIAALAILVARLGQRLWPVVLSV